MDNPMKRLLNLDSASLPFPANMMNSVYGNENENTNEINKTPLKLQDTLPLVGDYSDVPSTFLSDTTTSDKMM